MQNTCGRRVVWALDTASGLWAFTLSFLAAASFSPVSSGLTPAGIYSSAIVVFLAGLGALALGGAWSALAGKRRGLALAGCIAASISLPPLGIAATVLTLLSDGTSRLTRWAALIILTPVWLALLALLTLLLLGYSL